VSVSCSHLACEFGVLTLPLRKRHEVWCLFTFAGMCQVTIVLFSRWTKRVSSSLCFLDEVLVLVRMLLFSQSWYSSLWIIFSNIDKHEMREGKTRVTPSTYMLHIENDIIAKNKM